MWSSRRLTIGVILLCQFVAALSALGMPSFFSLFLKKSYGSEPLIAGIPLAGIFFVVPTFFAGLTSPFWGRMADRYGKKRLLLRAQSGLGLSFFIAGYAKTPFQFFLALAIQGILGGTFAASKAYLATLLEGESLAKGLTWMEASSRAALVSGPFLVGYFMEFKSPIEIYRYLALLPVFSAAMTALLLPSDSRLSRPLSHEKQHPLQRLKAHLPSEYNLITPQAVLALQFAFGMSAVMISPYFNLTMSQRFTSLSHGQIGLIFGLPHLTYLACAAPMTQALSRKYLLETLMAAFAIQAVSVLGQAQAHSLMALISYRIISGLSMTAIFISLHLMISTLVTAKTAGGLFGRIERSFRLSTVLGGLIASISFGYFGTGALFQLSSATLAVTSIYLLYSSLSQRSQRLQRKEIGA